MSRRLLLIPAATLLGLAAWGSAQPGRSAPGVEPPSTEIQRGGCVTAECHPGVKSAQFLHGPVHVNACDSCHTLADPQAHAFEFTRGRRETCGFCHVVEAPEGEVVHAPFAEGECLSCHDPHGGRDDSLLRGRRYADSCDQCHTDVGGAHDRVHGPVAAGACGACHRPHSAPHEGLLTLDGRELCLRCHVTTGMELESMHWVHAPAEQDCRVCHDPHASDHEAILNDGARAVCTACHADIAETIGQAQTQHEAVTSEQSCLNCHTAHASDHERMLKDESVRLCFECHDREIELEDGAVLANMKELIETGVSLHGPVAENNCTACHEIHGGGHQRLLTHEYPSALYYPYSENAYALCFSCHDRQLVLVERNEAVTGFRNGAQNLHFVHVNKDDRGRSCRICHDSHAAQRDHHIRDSIPYGPAGWELPIGYTRTEQGGTCQSGCHQPFEYNRVDPVDYPARENDDSWRGGPDLIPGREEADQD